MVERIDDLGRIRFAKVRLGETRIAVTAPPGVRVTAGRAHRSIDPAQIHVYVDSRRVAGEA